MTEKLKILIAENDVKVIDKLREIVDEKSVHLFIARDGVLALQTSLQERPDLIILSLELPLIDGVKLSQIIRTNPKTESIPILYLNEKTVQLSHFRRGYDYFIIKPFNPHEFRKILEDTKRKILTSEGVKSKEEFSGTLKQMSIPDIIQILSLNQRTGNLYLTSQNDKEAKSVVSFKEGRIINAKYENTTSVKAFYRILNIQDGYFKFIPAEPELQEEIKESTDSLLMEGLRQNDEIKELVKSFPQEKFRILLNVKISQIEKGLRPKTLDVLSALEVFTELREVLDNLPMPDYEILKILIALKEKGIISFELIKEDTLTKSVLDFSSDLILEFKKALMKKFPDIRAPYNIPVMVFFIEKNNIEDFLSVLINLNFSPNNVDFLDLKRGKKNIGYLGNISIIESLYLHLFFATDYEFKDPFYNAFLNMFIGGMVVDDKIKPQGCVNYYGKRCVVLPKGEMTKDGIKFALERIFRNFVEEVM
ncbi:MAG: DUF4388 domain-containing protein [Proteobacteria bacterium]|nr:DUF4388 domain-containing protein [Pseudomonadota bacterium]